MRARTESESGRRSAGLVLLGILALSAALRLFRLADQSLWADEMSSLVTAVKPVPQLLYDISNEIHPPLYHLMLKLWLTAFGTSEAGIRSMSALFGVVLVLLTYLLGARLLGRTVGLLAAGLSAIAPFQIYYSQEARMYMPLAAVSAAAVYVFVRYMEPDGEPAATPGSVWAWGVAYAVINGLGLWLHYSYPIILVMENLVYGLWWLLTWRQGRPWPRALRWILIQLLVIGIYLPWLSIGYRQVATWPAISRSYGLTTILQEAMRLFALGESVDPAAVGWTVAGFVLVFAVGLWPVLRVRRDSPGARAYNITAYVLLVCYALFPILMTYGLSLLKPAYRPKFFLVGSAGFSIVLARGILGPWARRGLRCQLATAIWIGLVLGFVIASAAVSLNNYYFVPRFARDDYRGIARDIQAGGKSGDAVLLNASGQKDVFSYYYRGELPVFPLPRQRPPDVERTVAELEEIAAGHRRLYAVFWATDESDPDRVVESWLDQHGYKALDEWRGNVRLAVYAMPASLSSGTMQRPIDAMLGQDVRLLGYSIPEATVRSGDVLRVALFWQAAATIDDRYTVFLHLLDGNHAIVAQRDAEPGGGGRLTTSWIPGEVVVDNYGLLIKPGTPAGEYALELGMYRADEGQRLPATQDGSAAGDRVLLPQTIVVQ